MPHKRTWLIFISGFLWLLLVSLAYVYTHKPFSPAMFLALSRDLWVLWLNFWLLSVSGGLGQAILERLLRPHPGGRSEEQEGFTLPLAIGMGILSLIVLGIGLFTVRAWSFALLLLILSAWHWRSIRVFWQRVRAGWQAIAPSGGAEIALALLVAALLFLNLSRALAPPLVFDALVYHLTLPLRYLQEGHITYIPEIMFWGMPQLGEMHYLLLLTLGGASAPAVLGWGVGMLALLGLGERLQRRFGRMAGWFAITALMSGPTISDLLSAAYLEWFLILYALAWWQALENVYEEEHDRRWEILLGMTAGFALSLKYTAGVLSLLTLAVVAWRFRKDGRQSLRPLFRVALIITLTSLPWWLKNLAWTGNPFYPLLFPSGAMDAFRYDFYHHIPSDLSWKELITFPWYITIWGVDRKVGPSASIGPLFLAFWPFAYAGWKGWTEAQRRRLRLATFILLGGFFIWALAASRNGLLVQTRLFMPLFPIWSLLSAAGFLQASRLRVASIRFGRIALAFVSLFVTFSVIETLSTVLPGRSLEQNLGLLSDEDYLMRNLGDLYAASTAIQSLPADSRVIMLWETRGFYCVPRCEPDEIIDRWYQEVHLHRTAAEIREAWLAQGYTHMLIWEAGFEFIREHDNAKFKASDFQQLEALRNLLGSPQAIGSYTLYPLRRP
jgi:hypothetical protein